jgi:hypothetical protein
MKKKIAIAAGVAMVVVAAGAAAVYANGVNNLGEALLGYDEVPALSTPGRGEFSLRRNPFTGELRYELSYADLETDVQQAHIHFGNAGQNGPITVFLCTNLGNGPAGVPTPQVCPPAPATISGTITAADVGPGAAANGLAAGEFDELVRAIRNGATYVNVHSTGRPAGEIRAQVRTPGRFWH